MHALPASEAAWRDEVIDGLQAAMAEAERRGLVEDAGEQLWHLIEDQAVSAAFARRGSAPLPAPGDERDRVMDLITDLTVRLRQAAPGDPDDHHLDETQFYALYYLAAQVHAGVLAEPAAAAALRACWNLADDPAYNGEGGEDDDASEPWEIRRPPPTTTQGWLDEVLSAWRLAKTPPPITAPGQRPYVTDPADVREVAVVLALHHRGAQADGETIAGLLGVIGEMEDEIADLGPELAEVRRNKPMAFTLFYLWTHILIGHADEHDALQVVHAVHGRLADFTPGRR